MLLITDAQQDQMTEVYLQHFCTKLRLILTQHSLLSETPEAIEGNQTLITTLINEGLAMGLEYESDIAIYVELVLCGHASSSFDIPQNSIEAAEESLDEITTDIDGNTSVAQSQKDESAESTKQIDTQWVDDLLTNTEYDGDERITLIESRWRQVLQNNEDLLPSIEMLDELGEIF